MLFFWDLGEHRHSRQIFVCLLICLFVYLLVCLAVYLFVCLFVCFFVDFLSLFNSRQVMVLILRDSIGIGSNVSNSWLFVSLFVCVITFGLLFGQHYKCLTSVPEGGFGSTDLGEKCKIGSRYLKALLSFPGSWILSLSWEIGSQYLKVPTIFPRSWTLSLSALVE